MASEFLKKLASDQRNKRKQEYGVSEARHAALPSSRPSESIPGNNAFSNSYRDTLDSGIIDMQRARSDSERQGVLNNLQRTNRSAAADAQRYEQQTRMQALQQLQDALNNDVNARANQIRTGSPMNVPMTTFSNKNDQAAYDQFKSTALKNALDNVVANNKFMQPISNIKEQKVQNARNEKENRLRNQFSKEDVLNRVSQLPNTSIKNRTAEDLMKGINTAEQEHVENRTAGDFWKDLQSGTNSRTAKFGSLIRPTVTGSGGNIDEYGRHISTPAKNAENNYVSANILQREDAIKAAESDQNNPLNQALEYLKSDLNANRDILGETSADVSENPLVSRERKSITDAEVYNQMTDEERDIYNYTYATYGKQRAEEYKNGLLDSLNARVGEKLYNDEIKNMSTLGKALKSYTGGVQSGIQGVADFGDALLGIENRQALTPGEYADQYLRSDEDNSDVQKILYDIAASTGNMTPGLVLSAMGAPAAVGSAVFGASMGGNAYREAMRNGNNASTSSLYALQQAADEGITNWLLGGINGFGGGVIQKTIGNGPVGQAIGRAIDNVTKNEVGRRLLKSVARAIGNAAGEAQQEYLQFYTENFTKALLGIKDENGNVTKLNTNPLDKEALYSAALGALNAMFLNLPGDASRIINGREADVSNAKALAAQLAETSIEDYRSEEVHQKAMELQAVAEEIGQKQDAGEQITSADKIAYNEAMSDFIVTANESDAKSELDIEDEEVPDYEAEQKKIDDSWMRPEDKIAAAAERQALKQFEEAENVKLPKAVADNMVDAYDPIANRHNLRAYRDAYKRAFVGGSNGVDFDVTVRSPLIKTYMTNDQILQAYKDGVKYASDDRTPTFTQGPARQGGLVYASENATASQKKIAHWVGNKTGLTVEIRDDIEGGGDIDLKKGVLRLNPNSKNFNQTVSHELTHLIRQFAPKEYETYKNLVVEALMNSRGESYDRLYAQYESRYGETGTTPNVDDVIEEMVADGSGQFLNDEAFINKITKQDRSLAEKIVDFFQGIVNALRDTMSQQGLSKTSQALRENYERYSKALDVWSNALTSASENYRGGLVVDNGSNVRNELNVSESTFTKEFYDENYKTVSQMSSVATLTGKEFDRKGFLKEDASAYFDSIGNKAYNDVTGFVDLTGNFIDDVIAHHLTRRKAIVLKAIPDVIRNGKVLDFTKDYNQGEDRIVLAAPVEVKGDTVFNGNYNVAVAIQVYPDHNKAYIHNVAFSTKNEEVAFLQTRGINKDTFAGNTTSSSLRSILEKLQDYNEKYAKSAEEKTSDGTRKQIEFDSPELAKDTGVYKGEDLVSDYYTKYSLDTFDSVGRETLNNQLKKEVAAGNMSKANANKIKEQMEWAYDMVKKYSDSGDYPLFSNWQVAEYKLKEDGTPVFSVVVPNGEYELNLDFTTVCKKRDTLDQVLTALARSGNLNYKKLNQKQLAQINQIIKANGFEIACSTCFVDSKRYNISNWAHSLTDGTKDRNGFNQAISSMLNDKVGAPYFNYVTVATKYNGKDTLAPGQKMLSELSNEELLKLNPHAFDYINERMQKVKPSGYEYRMLKAIKENPALRSFLNPNDFISSIGQDIIQEQNPALHTLLQSLGGSSRPKPSHGRVAYYSEILNNKNFTPEEAYRVGGVRVQSFSDYMANMVFDYMQMIGDMAAKQLPSHAYTKEPIFAKLYGLTGMKINMSIMPKAVDWVHILHLDGMNGPQQAVKIADMKRNLTEKQVRQLKKYAGLQMELTEDGDFVPVRDANGNYIPIVDDETFPMEEALKIRSADGYKENCGTIWIGTSDEQIRTLLRMEEADMVIPYHASSLNAAVKEMRNIEFLHDYTRQQRTREKSGDKWKAIPANKEFDFYESLMRTKDGKTTANEYLAWCDEHGYKPKFDQFRKEDNYYKLLEDFRLYDGDTSVMQGAVQMNFPEDGAAFGSFESLMEESLKEANTTANSLGQKLPAIVDQIKSELGLNNTKSLRKQLDLDYDDKAVSYAPVFYSKLQREVEAFKGERIGAASVESYLKGKGVKDDEIKWSSIRTFLEGKKSVGKQELMDYLKANELQIEVQTLVPGGTSPIWTNGYAEVNTDYYYDPTGNGTENGYATPEEFKADAVKRAESDGFEESEIVYTIDDGYWSAETEDGDMILEAYPPDPYDLRDGEFYSKSGTKWDIYTLPGGENYREILFRMPGSDYINGAMRTHWKGETGVLAHARVQDFDAEDGGRVLFVEEIQSDWHNAGQMYGYGEENQRNKANAYTKEREQYVRESLLKTFPKNDVDAYLNNDRAFLDELPWDKYHELLDAEGRTTKDWNEQNESKYSDMLKMKIGAEDVQDAPFRNNYTDFVLKDLLRMAAEGDYDYLAWTTGKMQEDRWLSKYAEGYRIEYDQDIPKFLKKYGKQWNAGLSEVTLNDEKGSVVPAIVVNDAMKKSVLYEGQPRFQLDIDEDTGFETYEIENDNQDLLSASQTLGKLLNEIDQVPSKKVIHDTALAVRKRTGTNESVEKIKRDIETVYTYLASNHNIDGADISHIVADMAGELISKSDAKINPIDREIYREFRDHIRRYTFHMPAGSEGELQYYGGVGALRKEFFGTINITKDKGSTIDQVWLELCELYPEYFDQTIISPGDQLDQIIEMTRSLKPRPVTENMSEEEYDVFRYAVGQDILKAFINNSQNTKLKAKYEEKLEKGLQKAKEKARVQRQNQRIRKLDRQARTDLLTKAHTLSKMKGGPEFEAAKQELIGNLDLIAKGIRSDTKARLEAMKKLADDLAAKDEDYKKLYYDSEKEVFNRLEKIHINDMTGEDVADLTNKIVELIYQERAAKRMLNDEMGHRIATVGRRAISQQSYAKGINGRNEIGSTFGRYALNMLNPTRAMQMLDGYQQGGVFTQLGNQLNEGQTKQKTFIMNASKKFNGFLETHPDLVKTWNTQDIDTGLKDEDGNPVYISKGMRISMYLHNMNTQNRRHIAEGGLEIPDAKLLKKGKISEAYRYATTVKLKPTDISRITDGMTDDEIAFARLAHEFLNKDTKDAINETSLTLSGTLKAIVDDYFPIRTDKNFTMGGDISGLVQDGTIEGMGMLKERIKGAAVPILLEDVAQVLQRQINNTALYYGLAVPVRDTNKVLKFKEAGNADSVRNSVNKTWGDAGIKYIEGVLRDIQTGAPTDSGPAGEIINKLKSTYAGTVLNWNLGVAIKQSASAPFAAVVLDAKSIAKAFAKNGFSKADYDYMDSITPWSYMRRQGMSGTEMGEVYKQKNMIQQNRAFQKVKNATNWIQNVDVWTTDRLFFATEYYVQEHYPNLKVRGDEYNQKVAELYNDMLQRTQPSYDVMQRNAYLRSENGFAKITGMFKTQTFNMGGEVINSWAKLKATEQMFKDHRASDAEVKKVRAQFGRTVAATVTSQMMLAVLGIVAKAIMHNMKNYRDDKGEVTPESIAARGIYEFLTSFSGMTIGGSELQSFGIALTGKEKWYDLEYPGLAVINDLVSSSVDMTNAYRKAVENNWDTESANKFRKKAIEFGMNAAIAKRIPADNIYKLGNAFYLWYQDWKNGKLGTFDAGEGLFGLKDSSVTKEQYARQVLSAVSEGDTKKADYAMEHTTKTQIESVLGAEGDGNKGSVQIDALKKIDAMDISVEDKVKIAERVYGFEGLTPESWSDYVKVLDAKIHGNQEGVIEYLDSSNLPENVKRNLWENACGYSKDTFDKKIGQAQKEETKTEAKAQTKTETKQNTTASKKESKSAAEDIEKELTEGSVKEDKRYAYIVDQVTKKKHTAAEAVEWFKSDEKRTNAAKYKAWKSAGGTDYDYIKTRADLTRFEGSDKQEKIARYLKKQNISDAKKRVIWFDIMDYSQSKWNKYMQ